MGPDYGTRVMKVNHAGEHGAVNIYAGQMLLAKLTARRMLGELAEFRSHEERHRAVFSAELQRRNERRCRSYVLCGLGGYVLGLFTGLAGSRAIAATTVAVERVVLRHLEHQLAELEGRDAGAVAAIRSVINEEREHHDRSASRGRTGGLWERLLSPVVSASTEAVIWVGMRA